ncbi:MAG: glycosyltransferase family 2 protein [Candidatus Eisenbacteria bacterium]
MLTIDVLIPARDEAAALPLVLADLPRTGDGWRVRRVVVVDNGSRDGTADVARAAGAEVVTEPVPGYGRACLAGLAHMAACPPDVVVFLDGDHSDDPADLPALLVPLATRQAELVIGSRVRGEREPGAFTPVQEFGNRLSSLLLRWLWGVEATDLGPFRAIRWSALQALRMRDPDFGWTVEMQARAAHEGVPSVEVPVRYRRRRRGRSKIAGTLVGSVRAGYKILATIARVRSED